jgi:uncharacterized membrane protein
MTSKYCIVLAVIGISLAALCAGAATAHEAHRKADSVNLEAAAAEQPPETIEPAGVEPAAPAGVDSTHQAHSPADADAPVETVSIIEWLGRLHPMAIHFPIALFIAALVAEFLYAATRSELFRHALRFTLWGAAMSALVAAPLGWIFAATGTTEEGWLLEAHRWAGTAALVLGVVVLWIGERSERKNGRRLLLRISLAFQAILIGSAGFLGGSLLYGFDHLWRGIGCCFR